MPLSNDLGHGTNQDMTRRPPGGSNIAPSGGSPVRHAWVVCPDGVQRPGLLCEWRQTAAGAWEGLAIYPEPTERGWSTVQGWLPHARLSLA